MIKLAKEMPISVSQTSGSLFWRSTEGAQKAVTTIDSKNNLFSADISICSEAMPKCCWHPPTLWIGIGCEKNTSENLINRALRDSLVESGLAKESIAGLATIDIKSDEIAIEAIRAKESLPIRFYSSEELSKLRKIKDQWKG